MSLVTAVKYLAEFAAEALKPWDPSREKAAVMLADLPLMVRLREDDVATADEVTYLVLGRFAAAEVPTIEGADWLADGVAGLKEMADAAAAWLDKPTQADADVLVAEAVAVLKCAVRQGSWFCQLPAGHGGDCAPEAVAVLDEPKCNGNCIADGTFTVVIEDLCCPLHGVKAVDRG